MTVLIITKVLPASTCAIFKVDKCEQALLSLFPYTPLLKEDGNFYSLFLYILSLKEPGDSPVPFHFFLLKGDGNFHVPNLGSLSDYRNMEISMCLYVVLHKGTWKFPCMYLSLLPKEHGNFRVLYPLCKPGNLLHIFFIPHGQGHPTSYFGKYLFGRRFEI